MPEETTQGNLLDNDEAKPSESEIHFVSEGWDGNKLDDKYRTDAGGINATAMLNDLHELRSKQEEVPEVPESYTLPEALKEAEGSPEIAAFAPVAREAGLSQEAYEKVLTQYQEEMVKAEDAAREETMAELKRELPNADQMIEKNRTFFQSHLSEDAFNEFAATVQTAGQLKAVDEIRNMLISKGKVTPPGANSGGSSLTEGELEAMMKSDAYWKPNHPEYQSVRDRVSRGFEKLYGGASR